MSLVVRTTMGKTACQATSTTFCQKENCSNPLEVIPETGKTITPVRKETWSTRYMRMRARKKLGMARPK